MTGPDDWTDAEMRAIQARVGTSAQRVGNAMRSLENALRELARARDLHGAYHALAEGLGAERARALGMVDQDGNPIFSEVYAKKALEARAETLMVTDWVLSCAVMSPEAALTTGEDWTQHQVHTAPSASDRSTLGLIGIADAYVRQRIVVEGT